MKFKVGDKVVPKESVMEGLMKSCDCFSSAVIDNFAYLEITVASNGSYSWSAIGKDGLGYNTCSRHGELINDNTLELYKSNNTNKMTITEKFALAFKSEPEKSFRKAGITNGDDFLTDDGTKIFLGWLLKEHGAKFKTDVVDNLLEEDK